MTRQERLDQELAKARELDGVADWYKGKILAKLSGMVQAWMQRVDDAGGPTAENLKSAVLRGQIDPPSETSLATQTLRMLAMTYLLGMEHVSSRLDLADIAIPDVLPFEEAVAFMRSRVPMTKKEWKALEPKLRFRAFTVAALSEPDAIERVRQHMITAVEKGTTVAEFWTSARAESAAGLAGPNPGYWENVYRTNIQTAYNAGRAAEFVRTQPEYLEFVGIEDGRQTDICAARSGTVLPSTHPFWSENWPPLHFRCRSTVRAVYKEELDTDSEMKRTPEEEITNLAVGTGFGGNPIDSGSFWQLTPRMIERAERYGIMEDIRASARMLGLKDPGLQAVGSTQGQAASGAKTEAVTISSGRVIPMFKSIKQAEKWIIDNNLADNVGFKGCDLKVVTEWAEGLAKALDDFPMARPKIQFFGTIQSRNRHLAGLIEEQMYQKAVQAGIDPVKARPLCSAHAKQIVARWRADPNVIAEYCRADGVNGIPINEKFGRSYEAFSAVRFSDVAAGWKPIGTERVVSSLQHEMGHLLDDLSGLSKSAELRSYYGSLSAEEVNKNLSRYGATTIHEFVAEGWSEYSVSETPRAIAQRVAEMLLQRIGGKP